VTAVREEKFEFVKKFLGIRGEAFLSDYGAKLIERWSQGGKSVDEVVWGIIPTAAAATGTQAQGVSQKCHIPNSPYCIGSGYIWLTHATSGLK